MGLRVGQLEGPFTDRRARTNDLTRSGERSADARQPLFDVALLALRRRVRQAALMVLIVSIAVEAVLFFRLWAQVTNKAFTEGVLSAIYGVSNTLTSPFRSVEAIDPVRSTGIIDISTVVAIEVYLIAAIAAWALLLFANVFLRIVIGFRNRSAHKPYLRPADYGLGEVAPSPSEPAVPADR